MTLDVNTCIHSRYTQWFGGEETKGPLQTVFEFWDSQIRWFPDAAGQGTTSALVWHVLVRVGEVQGVSAIKLL